MAILSPLDPQPSLEGGSYRPSPNIAAPIVNAVDTIGSNWNPHRNPLLKLPQPEATPNKVEKADWVRMARNAYESSESWLQVNQRAIWARNFAHYRSEHGADSTLNSEAHRHRANYFWPKSRTLVRAIQAAAASAYFTSSDVVAIEAEDTDNSDQRDAAELMKALVNYRLSQTIPWYLLVLGGIAEAAVLGTVASHQSWDFREAEVLVGKRIDPSTGELKEYYETKILQDKPAVRLVPVENVRISPASDWVDPANSSPYLIELMPMYLGDVLTKIREGKDSKNGEPIWYDIGAGQLLAAGNRDNLDSTRRARSGGSKLDPKSNMMESVDEFRIVWIHRNIVRRDGIDWLYYTAGVNALLSDPVPLSQVIPWAGGKRDYILGKLEVETDRPYPSGPVELTSGMQKAINELKNQRYDNVRQVLNRRYLYRQGNQVDVRALMRNVPGGVIGVSAPGALSSHVEPLPVQDVTASSFQEEDRLSLAMDDLSGSTSGSTVNSNRRLQETATGMNLMNEAANQVREMELRTFTETWIEPVLRQIVQLEAAYETDAVALTVAAKKAKLLKILPKYFDYSFSVSVNVGMGAVSPTQRMQRIQSAVATTVSLVPDAGAAIVGDEIAKEIFGAAGFDNGSRFFDFAKVEEMKANPQPDPQQQIAQQQMEAKAQNDQGKLEIAQGKLQLENSKLEMENQKLQVQMREIEAKINLIVAQTATANVTAVYEASQAAGVVAQNPGIAPMSDEILKSSGFMDHNSAPIVPELASSAILPDENVPLAQNTHPNFPPNPASAQTGIMKGIETPQLEA
jgi:hypothetical protein